MKIKKSLFIFLMINSLLHCSGLEYDNPIYSDLDTIYYQIKENHPGIYNEEDPFFNEHLESAYQQALISIQKASNLNLKQQVIERFTKSFNDTHLWIHWHSDHKKHSESHNVSISHFEIRNISPNIFWVTLPTFALNHTQKIEFAAVERNLSNLNHSKAIIFDVRNNMGGNSMYGTKIIEALFGKEYADQQINNVNALVSIDWRASRDNLEYIRSVAEQFHIQDILYGLEASFTQHKPYYHETTASDAEKSISDEISHGVTAQIFVIIDSNNVSAALDFIDELKMMNYPITLIGQTTKSDRLYMEIRTMQLPSGLGEFSFPIKVYRDRVRKDNEPYQPDIEINTHNTRILESTILHLIS